MHTLSVRYSGAPDDWMAELGSAWRHPARDAQVEGSRSNAHRQLRHDQAAPVRSGGLRLAARRLGAQVLRAAARRFNQIAWCQQPALAVLVATGIGNIASERDKITGRCRTTLAAKLAAVPVPGITAFLRARSRSTTGLAVFSALTGASVLAALFLGVLLAG